MTHRRFLRVIDLVKISLKSRDRFVARSIDRLLLFPFLLPFLFSLLSIYLDDDIFSRTNKEEEEEDSRKKNREMYLIKKIEIVTVHGLIIHSRVISIPYDLVSLGPIKEAKDRRWIEGRRGGLVRCHTHARVHNLSEFPAVCVAGPVVRGSKPRKSISSSESRENDREREGGRAVASSCR